MQHKVSACNKMTDNNITSLLELARQGNTDAENALFDKLSARFRFFIRQKIWDPEEREDIVQEAMIVISREYKNMEFTSSFTSWAYKVLDNRIRGYIQTRKRQSRRLTRIEPNEIPPEFISTEIDPDFKRRLLNCLKAVGKANPRYSRILNLHYHGYTSAEIGRRLGLTRNNLYSVMSRARAILQLCLEKKDK
jgi:RNA polymerase sigma-70 factor, ECF subfamily